MITLINGHLQTPGGVVVQNGSISFQLNVDGVVIAAPGGIVLAEEVVVFQLDSTGNIQSGAQIYSNAELQPQNSNGLGTYYLVTIYDANGARVNKNPMWWQFTEAASSTVDISNMTPYSTVGGNVIFYPIPAGGGGSVTSVAFVGDGTVLSPTPSTPVTTSGNISATLLTQSANLFLAGPTTGAAANPTFRAIVAADISGLVPVPGGSTTDVQFNNAGVFGGDGNFTYNFSTETVSIGAVTGVGRLHVGTNFTVNENSLLFSVPANTLFPVQFGLFSSNIGGQFFQIVSQYTGTGNNAGGNQRTLVLATGSTGTAGKLGELTTLYAEVDLNSATGAVITNAYGVNIGINTGGGGTQVSSTGVNVAFLGTTDPSFAYGFRVQPATPTGGTVVWGLYCDNTPGFFGGGAGVTWGGASAGIASIGAASTSSTGSFVLTQVTNNGDGTTTYTGTISGGSGNVFAGSTFVVTGFTTSNQSNGTFVATASTSTTLTVTNNNSVNQTHAGTAVLVPNRMNFPIATGASGQVLSTDGGSPQQLSWVTPFTSPMTTLGDIIYENATPAAARLAGNITATKMYLSQTGTGSISAAPIWAQIAAADLSNGTTGTGAVVLAVSPALTGSPTAPTQTAGDNTTKIATDAFVTAAIASAVAGVNPAVAVAAATAAILPNSPTYLNGVGGIGATITAGATNTTLVVDGYTPLLNDRILVKNESGGGGLGAGKNGVYFVSQLAALGLAWVLTRALDYDQPSDINSTGAIPVVNGTVNAITQWVLTSSITAVDGTQALTYAQFSLNPAVVTQTIASGTASLGTSLIASGAKASTVTVVATGVLSTDTLMADFNADPTAVTGYAPSASGMLTIIKFPTSGNVNFIVVNNTGASITPGAITLNWRVVR